MTRLQSNMILLRPPTGQEEAAHFYPSLPILTRLFGNRLATLAKRLASWLLGRRMYEDAHRFVESLGFVYPIVFESGDDYIPYYCGGTCFAVMLEGELFIVTAQHCLKEREGAACVIGPDGHFFPIKETFPLARDGEDNDWSDIVCVSTYGNEHWPALESKNTVNFGELIKRDITAHSAAFLAVKGYPSSHTMIEPPKIQRKASFHLGLYGGPTGDAHCHFFDIVSPPMDDPDGLSGSPVVLAVFDTLFRIAKDALHREFGSASFELQE